MATQNAATTKTAPAAKASAQTLKPEAEKLATLPASKNVPEKEEPTKTAPAAKASAETLKPEAEKIAALPAIKNVPEKEEPTIGVKITLQNEVKAEPAKQPVEPNRETLLKEALEGTAERQKALSNLERIYATREELNRYKPGKGEPFEGSLTITGGGYGNSKFTTSHPDIIEAAFELCRQKVEERVKTAENNLLELTTKNA